MSWQSVLCFFGFHTLDIVEKQVYPDGQRTIAVCKHCGEIIDHDTRDWKFPKLMKDL